MLKIAFKAVLVTRGVIAVSQILSFAIRASAGQPFTLFVFAMNSILPVVTAFPAAFIIFLQNGKLKRALAELSRAHAQLHEKYRRDGLTGFLSREAFFEQMKQSRRQSDAGALLLIDADHFKRINDTFGHLTGDEALVMISRTIHGSIRELDFVGRVGGEEFCVFLPDTSREEAATIAERVRATVEQIDFRPDGSRAHRLTVSIGVAMAQAGQSRTQLMRQVDRCLYEAKEQGRNRVVFAQPLKLAA
ncbi:GGDEF domain-containing protein [Mesorhizobium sp. PAMC28654]|uniref:GGDEF domain-containing protein n=1 Tax=Mesorhizobium sp. PAMC28654 TaxID=2880934 RepID=UPI001D0AD36D|nr:GGDEF domain-containing protein [Mesorhizobium sp. PAMC28654]UDL89463.1 GGDEF domain-containing protein [Mesorhizobium sp. PAMC28654]